MLAALLFDLDGTLVDTDPFHFQAWRNILQDYDLAIDESFYQTRISGRLNPDIVQDLFPDLDAAAAQTLIEQKEACFRALAPELRATAGFKQVFDWAKSQEIPQGLVTNAPRDNVHFMLQALQLETAFQTVIIADDLGIGKPDPAPYRVALEQLGVVAGHAVAFEDSLSGVRSATAAGISTIGLSTTHDAEALQQVGATFVIPDFTVPQLRTFLGMEVPAPAP